MRCKQCEYPLWDLNPGPCPECGTVFDPTEFRFKTGEIRFCCPHCDQSYYGDDLDGHLRPRSFDCVSCGRRIDESECIVRPREDGSYEDLIGVDRSPWHEADLGLWKRFWRTVGMSMTKPAALGRGLPPNAGLGGSMVFFMLVYGLSLVIGLLPFIVLSFVLPLIAAAGTGGGGPGPGGVAGLVGIMVGGTLVTIPASIIGIAIFATLAHVVLKLSGSTSGGIGRTMTCIGFGSGPLIIGAVPIVGYCLQTPASIWALVSCILVLRGGQGVSGLRASFAMITPVLLLIALYVAFVLSMIFGVAAGIGARPAGFGVPVVAAMGQGVTTVEAALLADEIVEAETLPDVPTVMASPAVQVVMEPWSTTPSREPQAFSGRGFEGWWIPGLLVVKGDEGAVVAVVETGPATKVEVTRVRRSAGSTSTGNSTVDSESAGSKIVSFIDEIDGVGSDLPASTVEAWLEATRREGGSVDEDDAAPPASGNATTPDP